MEAKYFNEWEFNQALCIKETDPQYAKILFEKYLEKYPKDYSAYTFYCTVLVALGEFKLAEKVLDFVQISANKDHSFNKIDKIDKIEKFKKNIFYTKIQLLSYQGKNEELYRFCVDNYREIIDKNMNGVLFYSKKKTGRLDLNKRDENSYLFRQMVKYEEKDFLNHIKKHLSDYNQDVEQPNKNIFVPNFPINEVVEEIKKYIPSSKRLFLGFYDNVYFFKYNECGRDNNKLVDYFKVVCFHDTNEFITMCPVSGSENLPFIDLNYLVKADENVKVKRISQIEKFNKKFNKK